MPIVSIDAADASLDQLLTRVEAGEEVVLAGGSTPVAKIVSLNPARGKRTFGALRGLIYMMGDFLSLCRKTK